MSKLTKALTAAAGNAGGANLYVEDVFSTYVYEGTGSAQSIDNGIPLSDEGGLVWIKSRSNADSHYLFDTVNGPEETLSSDATNAGANYSAYWDFPAAGTEGFNLKDAPGNYSGWTLASWTFRKAEKFFDVVTYTGDGVAGRTVAHNLGSVPAFMIVKRTDASGDWWVYHSSLGGTKYMRLNFTQAAGTATNVWNNTAPTDSVFSVGNGNTNLNGATYVAYLFASDAGGFGDDGDESIIKCGSFTTNAQAKGSATLGFEPQWVMVKRTDGTGNWYMGDIMRGLPQGNGKYLSANASDAEAAVGNYRWATPTATGFVFDGGLSASADYIYIAIRRPMKTPESGTEVFNPTTAAVTTDITNNFAADLWFGNNTSGDGGNNAHTFASRLTGLKWLQTATTAAESTASNTFYWDSNTEFTNNQFGGSRVEYFLKRATGFFDVVAYTGVNSSGSESSAIQHNLSVVPEFIICKRRNGTNGWISYHKELNGGVNPQEYYIYLNLSSAAGGPDSIAWGTSTGGGVAPTSTEFTVGGYNDNGSSGNTYIAYLFATLAGVSKVGSYTGTGSNVDVDCGFSAGARFILIKRTDSTGDWYVYDSVRGITAGNDPYLLLNSTAAEVTSTDYIDPLSSGFTVTSSAPAALNASGGTYIFLAIA